MAHPNPVNLVDAIALTSTRYARNRSAVLRTGVVVSVGGDGFASVTVAGGEVSAAYHADTAPAVGDVVSLLTDRDMWLILGVITAAGQRPVRAWREAAGVAVLPINGKTVASVTVTYPAGRFTVAPVCTVSLYTGSGTAATGYTLRAWNNSATSITFGQNLTANANADFTIYWHAVQMTPTVAAG